MTNDLVRRLREEQPVTQDMESTAQCDLQDEAADRIEELEVKLAKAVAALENIVPILCEGVEGSCGTLTDSWCSACEGYTAIAAAAEPYKPKGERKCTS